MPLTKPQQEAIDSLIGEYITDEPEILSNAYNYCLSPDEIRKRCERWNQVILIGDNNRMQHKYTEKDIQEIVDSVS